MKINFASVALIVWTILLTTPVLAIQSIDGIEPVQSNSLPFLSALVSETDALQTNPQALFSRVGTETVLEKKVSPGSASLTALIDQFPVWLILLIPILMAFVAINRLHHARRLEQHRKNSLSG